MNATVTSVRIQLVVTMKMNVPTSVTAPETIWVNELLIMTSMLSISFVKRDMISPVWRESKNRTGSFCSFANRSLRIRSIIPCEMESINLACT